MGRSRPLFTQVQQPIPQQPSAYGVTPPYGSPSRVTNPSGAGLARPALPLRVYRAPVAYIRDRASLASSDRADLSQQGIIPGSIPIQITRQPSHSPSRKHFEIMIATGRMGR